MLRNTPGNWGWPAILFHWLTAATVIALFVSGLWMTGLDYYHPWYNRAPHWHKSVGLLLFGLVGLRLIWRLVNTRPRAEPAAAWEHRLADLVHWAIYLLLFAILLSGYLIPTADGEAIAVFNWFEVPALLSGLDNQETLAGKVHEYLAWALIAVVVVHVAGALKQHFINRNRTLARMLGVRS